MKILLGVIVTLLVFAGLLPAGLSSDYHVERSITINKSAEQVFPLVLNLEKWSEWDAWSKMEPNATYTHKKDSNGIAYFRSWAGKIVGEGEMEILSSRKDELINYRLSFTEGENKINSSGSISLENNEKNVVLTWIMLGSVDSYFDRYFSLFIDGMIGSNFEVGLANLKTLAEMLPEADVLPVAAEEADSEVK